MGIIYNILMFSGFDRAWIPEAPSKPWRCYSCEQCGNTYTSRDGFNKHMRNIHGDGQGPFICKICNSTLKNKRTLLSHMRFVHAQKHSGNTDTQLYYVCKDFVLFLPINLVLLIVNIELKVVWLVAVRHATYI